MSFNGFPRETLAFLAGLRANNERGWFEAHRADYDAYYVDVAREFVAAAGERLRALDPGVQAEPSVIGSIGRINRDIRFSADKRPYKDHLSIGFPHGSRKTAPSAFFLRVTPEGLGVGLGAHGFDKPSQTRFRGAVADAERGGALVEAVAKLESAGHRVLGEDLKRTPAGYVALGAERERLLRFTSLWAVTEEPAGPWLYGPEALDRALGRWQEMLPLHLWLVDAFA